MPAPNPLLRAEVALLKRSLALPDPVWRRLLGAPPRAPEGYPLDLHCQVILRLMALTRQPPISKGGPLEARRRFEAQAALAAPPPAPGVTVEERTVPGPAGGLRARLYAPAAGGPLCVFFHGGGWVVGSLDSHDGLCRLIAARTGARVLSVDYRLAPEHPFPAAVDDAIAAVRWAAAHAAELGGDPTRLWLAGDSAGGNLAALAALACRADPHPPQLQLLLYPGLDLTRSLPSHRHFANGFMLDDEVMNFYLDHYTPDRAVRRDPRCSPLWADDLAGAPRAIVVTAGFDPLRDEGRAYADRLRAAGVDATCRQADGMIHGFFSMGGLLQTARPVVDEVLADVRRLLG